MKQLIFTILIFSLIQENHADPCEMTELLSYMMNTLDPPGTCAASSNSATACEAIDGNAWSADPADTSPYLEFNFTREVYISKIRLSGAPGAYVETFSVSFQVKMGNAVLFYPILEDQSSTTSDVKVFNNTGGSDSVFGETVLCPRIRTQVIRIHPKTWIGSVPTILAELKGCNTHSPCTHCDGSCQCPWGYDGSGCSHWAMPPIDCEDYAYRNVDASDGVQTIYPPASPSFDVFCLFNFTGGGWTVLLSRTDDQINFDHTWNDYQTGFGNQIAKKSHWLGLENIHTLTSKSFNDYMALIYVETIDGEHGIALYNKFAVGDEASKYKLKISNMSMSTAAMGDSFSSMDGLLFYAKDADSPQQCSTLNSGGWWYPSSGSCIATNGNKLTGIYGLHEAGKGIIWASYKGLSESLLGPKLAIRRSPLESLLPAMLPKYAQPTDCQDIRYENPMAESGVYTIYPIDSSAINVYCEMAAHDGGWTVIQRRVAGDSWTSFSRAYAEYVSGFGDIYGSHWLGLENFHAITSPASMEMGYDVMVVIENANYEFASQLYLDAYLQGADDEYVLSAEDIDSTMAESAGDAMSGQLGNGFSTFDHPLGESAYPGTSDAGGWWWSESPHDDAHLNGIFLDPDDEKGVRWHTFDAIDIIATTIMIRPMYKNKPIDCADIYDTWDSAPSGVYMIFPFGIKPTRTYCDFSINLLGYGMGWTAVQRHSDPEFSFEEKWNSFRDGFKSSDYNDMWLGNEYLHYLSKFQLAAIFRVKSNPNGTWYETVYPSIRWASELESYKMTVGTYDATLSTFDGSGLTIHQFEFSTLDNAAYSCISDLPVAGWWIDESCDFNINLNGILNYTGSDANYGATWPAVHNNDKIGALATEIYVKRVQRSATAPAEFPNDYTTLEQFIEASHVIYQQNCFVGGTIDNGEESGGITQAADKLKAGGLVTVAMSNGAQDGDVFAMRHPWITGLLVWKPRLCGPYPDRTKDCETVQETATELERSFSRAHSLRTWSGTTFLSFCDMQSWGGGWTLVLRRVDGTTSFNRPGSDFENSFGDADGNFWLGLKTLRELTNSGKYVLMIEMRHSDQYGYIQQSNFWVHSDSSVWDLKWSSTLQSSIANSQLPFERFRDDPCASGPWWTTICGSGLNVNLNGIYGSQADFRKNIYYNNFYVNSSYALSWVEMKIRKAATSPFPSWIKASSYVCDEGVLTTGTAATADECKNFALAQSSIQKSVTFFSATKSCHVRDEVCITGEGAINPAAESYFRNDLASSPTRSCGPAPIMKNTDFQISGMPAAFSVSYTCKEGYGNQLDLAKTSTTLTCNDATLKWIGVWLDCKPLCGQLSLSSNNAYVTPYTVANSSTATFTTACIEGYDYEYGEVTRTCASPYTSYSGSNIMCSSNCRSEELLAKLEHWNGLITASSGRAEMANGNKALYWAPLASDPNPYVQINFGKELAVSVLKVAGYGNSWTTSYSVRFGLRHRGMSWQFYPVLTDMSDPFSNPVIIRGAKSGHYMDWMPYAFCPVLRTQLLRVYPETWVGSVPVLRLLAKGCQNHNGCHKCCKSAVDCSCRCALGYNGDKTCSAQSMPPIDCEEIAARNPSATSGVYTIYPPGVNNTPLSVYCDMERLGGGWSVLQARVDGSQDFYLDMNAYKSGFGNLSNEHWLGLNNMNMLTSSKYYNYGVLFYMEALDDGIAFAYYENFRVDSEAEDFKLYLGNYKGNAGDGFFNSNGSAFSTKDSDKDSDAGQHCAQLFNGAMWYSDCDNANINGLYGEGITWPPFRGVNESMRTLRMMVRRSPMGYVIPGLRPSNAWYPTDCEDIMQNDPKSASGIYTIHPTNADSIEVYCDMSLMNGGWTAIQRRVDGSQDFYLNWDSYKVGFGDSKSNFWLGNENIHKLTSLNQYSLAIRLEANDGTTAIVTYNHFRIDDEKQKYRLHVEGFNGLASVGDSLSAHSGSYFSTKDADNDDCASCHCSQLHQGGWWFKNCHNSNLNGIYASNTLQGLNWYTWKGYMQSMKMTEMLLRRYSKPPTTAKPIDCSDILEGRPGAVSGEYTIYPYSQSTRDFEPLSVYCEMAALGGGWTLFQENNMDGTFDGKTSSDYDTGFGSTSGDHWLGIYWLYELTGRPNAQYDMAFVLHDGNENWRSSIYNNFYVRIADLKAKDITKYQLAYEAYISENDVENAGDSIASAQSEKFNFYQDDSGQEMSPWWYYCDKSCSTTNLNGNISGVGIRWETWPVALSSSRIMFRPRHRKPYDCADAYNLDLDSGERWIYPPGAQPVKVLCDPAAYQSPTYGIGWTVIMQVKNALPLYNWETYKNGWGTPVRDFYIGHERLHKLTSSGAYSLIIFFGSSSSSQESLKPGRKKRQKLPSKDTTTEATTPAMIFYNSFSINSEHDGYRLALNDYLNLGLQAYKGDPLAVHAGQKFSTYDNGTSGICQTKNKNFAWWYAPNDCTLEMMTIPDGKGGFLAIQKMAIMKKTTSKPIDCQDAYQRTPGALSGIYKIKEPTKSGLESQVFCNMEPQVPEKAWGGTGWTAFSRRLNNEVDFNMDINSFGSGFGGLSVNRKLVRNSSTEYLLGFEYVGAITQKNPSVLMLKLTGPDGSLYRAFYDYFSLNGASGYEITFSDYYAEHSNTPDDSMDPHRGMTFRTQNYPDDVCNSTMRGAGWWYSIDGKLSCLAPQTAFLFGKINDTSADRYLYFESISSCKSLLGAEMYFKQMQPPRFTRVDSVTAHEDLSIVRHICPRFTQLKNGQHLRIAITGMQGIFSNPQTECVPIDPLPKDCSYYQENDVDAKSGEKIIYVDHVSIEYKAYCDQDTMGGGWTVIQRRVDKSTSFDRDMQDYEAGFGETNKNFWLGLKAIREITESQQYELLVEMRTIDSYAFSLYGDFAVSKWVHYLHIADFSDDSMAGDSLTYVNGSKFLVDSCGIGGWWMPKDCPEHTFFSSSMTWLRKKRRKPVLDPFASLESNLNAAYDRDDKANNFIFWGTFDNTQSTNLVWTEMKIRTKKKRLQMLFMGEYNCAADKSPVLKGVKSADECQQYCLTNGPCYAVTWNRKESSCTVSNDNCYFGMGKPDPSIDTYLAISEPGQWSYECGPPPYMNGTFANVTIGQDFFKVTYQCKQGFINISPHVSGQETTLQCLQKSPGKWLGYWLDCAEPCGSLPETTDSNATLTSYKLEKGVASYKFACLDGNYHESGDYFITCEPPYGNFTGVPLQCTSTPCPSVPMVSNATNSGDKLGDYWSRVVNQTIEYDCFKGYLIANTTQGYQTTTCTEDGLWIPDVFDCLPDCEPIGGCLNGGSCMLPNSCDCVEGWIGANCSEPDCSSLGGCLNGGTCTEPFTCTCLDGWYGSNCSFANCSAIGDCQNGGSCAAPNNCSCVPGWLGISCLLPDCSFIGGCLNKGNCSAPNTCDCAIGWLGINCAIPDCGGCLNGGSCAAPFNCSCTPFWNGSHCEIALFSATDFNLTLPNNYTLPDPANLSDIVITVKYETLNEFAVFVSTAIATSLNASLVAESATVFISALNDYIERYKILEGSLPTGAIENITGIYLEAADKAMAATLEIATITSAIVDDGSARCTLPYMTDLFLSDPEYASTLPRPTTDQTNKLLKDFRSLVDNVVDIFKLILKSGQDFAYDGKFLSGAIKKLAVKQLPGLQIKTKLVDVHFPIVSNSLELLSNAPVDLTEASTVVAVITGFIANVFDPTKPFNLPTISTRVFYQTSTELTLNPQKPLVIIARPILPKAVLYSHQKKEIQCDISKIQCVVAENGDRVGSLVSFRIDPKAGDFVFTFPPDEFEYSAFVALNSTPIANSYDWTIRVNSSGAYATTASAKLNDLALFYANDGSDLHVLLRKQTMEQFLATKPLSGPLNLFVSMKRNLSHFDVLDDLPTSVCALQRCYGFHLRIGKTSAEINLRKRRQAIADSEDFELYPSSSESQVSFKSSYFGDFGADLVIMPNTIEFSDIFSNFSQLVQDNYIVLAFQVTIVVLFLVCIGFTIKFDKEDLREWAFLPLQSNKTENNFRYLISVNHYGVRRFDLGPKIFIKIYGDTQNTRWRRLDDGTRKNFEGKLPANFLMSTFIPIGKLEACEIAIGTLKRENIGERTYEMTLDKITVIDLQNGGKHIFIAKKKLKAGQSCLFELAKEDDIKGFRYLVSSHSRIGLPESHPWLSISRRPLPSNWTRTERLASVVSALFMAMLVNAMFYGKETTAPRVGINVAGIFRISWFTIWTSVIGSVIVIPPTGIMAFIFKRVKRRSAEKSEWSTIFNVKVEAEDEDDEKENPKKKSTKKSLQLPWGCVIIGWILVAASVGVSSFMVIMYSLSWGREKSLQWLSGMLMHIAQDIIVIQTVKVMLFSVFNSTLLSLPDDGLAIGKQIYAPGSGKPKTELFRRLRNVIAGIFHHFIYVAAFAAVIGTTLNFYSYQQVNDMKPLFKIYNIDPLLGTINDYATIYDWLNDKLLPNFLYGNQLINGFKYQKRTFYRVPNHDVALMGAIRLRQQRVIKSPCHLEQAVVKEFVAKSAKLLTSNETTSCQRSYTSSLGFGDSSENRPFNLSWNRIADGTHLNTSDSTFHPWFYRGIDGTPYAGWHATYKPGGYYVDLPIKINKARTVVETLRALRWLDNSTTVMFVDLVFYNPQVNIFVAVKIVFEALDAGGMTYHFRLNPLNLYQYSGASSFMAFAIQGFWFLTLASHLVKTFIQMKKQGPRQFCKDGWNILNFLQLILSFCLVALFAARIYVIINTVSRFQQDRTTFLDLDLLVDWESLMFGLYGLALFMTLMLFFRHLQANKHWAMFLGTLSRGKAEISSFVAVFVIISIIFSTLGYSTLGTTCPEFRSFTASLMTLVQNIIGVSRSLMSLSLESRFIMVFCLAYSSLVTFLAVNVFMTIISVTYATVANNVEANTNWDVDLADYISDEWKKLAGVEEEVERKAEYSSHKPTVENVLRRLDHFVEKRLAAERSKFHRHGKFVNAWKSQLEKVFMARRKSAPNIFQNINNSWSSSELTAPEEYSMTGLKDSGDLTAKRRYLYNKPVNERGVNLMYPFTH